MQRCQAEINLDAIRANARFLNSLCRKNNPANRICAVIKADAYGHGIKKVTNILIDEVAAFGVANVGEASEVAAVVRAKLGESKDLLKPKIFILSPTLCDEMEICVREAFLPLLSSVGELRLFAKLARKFSRKSEFIWKIDFGMGRAGSNGDETLKFLTELKKILSGSGNVKLHSIASHFPNADADADAESTANVEQTRRQVVNFANLVNKLRDEGLRFEACQILNSPALLAGYFPKVDLPQIARCGLALYGCSPFAPDSSVAAELVGKLRLAMRLTTRVILVKEIDKGQGVGYGSDFRAKQRMKVALLSAGYGDGYPRAIGGSADASAIIAGSRHRLLGRVSMDLICVNAVGEGGNLARVGDEAVLLGVVSSGSKDLNVEKITANLSISPWHLARQAGTIPWEIFTGITKRVPRFYYEE